ncbi:MAG: UDP-N-acetylmuramate--L-alanine ligase [Dehalococcoidia bacterium]|nr:UDP-N-acetylmuramate--L-alanine ligase [Dehalococcoidia bacterium]
MSAITGPVHLVGIGGMHMSAIAQLLLERGVSVSGSDLRPSEFTARLEARGARVYQGHAAEQVHGARLVVTTAAAAADNPELVEARRLGIPVLLRAEMVARLIADKRVVAVAGAHGKTTTSSLIAFILSEAGRQPMYLLGGESLDLGGHAAWGAGDLCVVEADEYKRAFLEYEPSVAVVTNVEPDHLDYYGTPEAYHAAFTAFARRVRAGGLLLACTDDPGAAALASQHLPGARVETYGLEGERDWLAHDIRFAPAGASFRVEHVGEDVGDLHVNLPAGHLVANALAAAAACLHVGVPFAEVAAAVARFRGARRRFETVGESGGVFVMDDYAHHPSEVRTTIAAARRRFPGQRLIAVYQPHTYSRIAYLWDEWTRCWEGLDALVVLETYAARETPLPGRGARDLAAAVITPPATYAADFADAARQAVALARPGDVVFTIGAGDVVEVGPRLLELLR